MGHTCRDDIAQTSPMEELAHDLLATGNHSCGSWGPATWRSSRTACGGPTPIFEFGGVRPIAWRMNGAARQALTARAMLVLADRGPGSVRDRAAARPYWHGPFDPR